jgi:hypothetical protein
MRRIAIFALGAALLVAAPGSFGVGLVVVGVRRWRQRNLVQVIYPRMLEVHTPRLTITVCR